MRLRIRVANFQHENAVVKTQVEENMLHDEVINKAARNAVDHKTAEKCMKYEAVNES